MSACYMPLYQGDYHRDTGHLTTLEHGAYLLLLMHYYAAGKLPKNDESLARIVKLNVNDWLQIRENIAPFFSRNWRQKRVEHELRKRQTRVNNGKKGGRPTKANGKLNESQFTQTREDPAPFSAQNLSENCTQNEQAFGNIEEMGKANGKLNESPKPSQANISKKEYSALRAAKANRKKPSISIPDHWHPSADLEQYAREHGIGQNKFRLEMERFRNHARTHDRHCVNWDQAAKNWLLLAAEKSGAQVTQKIEKIGFHADFGSAELDAWDAYGRATRGMNYPRDRSGGWTFPTRWPPKEEENADAPSASKTAP